MARWKIVIGTTGAALAVAAGIVFTSPGTPERGPATGTAVTDHSGMTILAGCAQRYTRTCA